VPARTACESSFRVPGARRDRSAFLNSMYSSASSGLSKLAQWKHLCPYTLSSRRRNGGYDFVAALANRIPGSGSVKHHASNAAFPSSMTAISAMCSTRKPSSCPVASESWLLEACALALSSSVGRRSACGQVPGIGRFMVIANDLVN
jgi:hypothetical protein